ncbi:MAG: TIGR04086 family membrane protein [Firmicutes bacterium]|nr:TIGR04086 family membrane protein [Bacillota bacterium]
MNKSSIIRGMTKGTLWALVATLFLVLILAVIVKFTGIGSTAILVTTQIIKIIAIFFGVGVLVKSVVKRAWLFGAIFGIIYTAVSFFAFSLIGGTETFDITTGILAEALFAIIVGMASAILVKKGSVDAAY